MMSSLYDTTVSVFKVLGPKRRSRPALRRRLSHPAYTFLNMTLLPFDLVIPKHLYNKLSLRHFRQDNFGRRGGDSSAAF
jgi:hypothetical protein